jgi:hypothetical protein
MQTPRIRKTVTVSVLAAGTLSMAIGLHPASAAGPMSEQYAGRAGAQVAEVSLLGRGAVFGSAVTDSALEAVGRRLTATATGTGTDLSPATRSVARFGDDAARGGEACAETPLGQAVTGARPTLAEADSRALPGLAAGPACGRSTVSGTADTFVAESTGGATRLDVKLPEALKDLVGRATAALSPETLGTPVGELVRQATTAAGRRQSPSGPEQAAATAAGGAVDTLNGVLGRIAPGVAVPAMEPRQTVGAMLQQLGSTDLVHINLARATARNGGDSKVFVAEALSEGGVIEVLPGFRGAGSGPLVRMTLTRSRAAVPVDRSSLQAGPVVENAAVRVESAVPGVLPVAGPGLRSGPGFVEVGPGQSLSVLCDGPTVPLCSEITVGAAKAPVSLPGGPTHAESSTVTVHLFKALDHLTPGASLGTVLAQPAVARALQAAVPANLGIGNPTGIAGIRLVAGGVVAEAGGSRVLGAEVTAPSAASPAPPAPPAPPETVRNLPHTGGRPFSPATAPMLLLASAVLTSLLRRTRRAGA